MASGGFYSLGARAKGICKGNGAGGVNLGFPPPVDSAQLGAIWCNLPQLSGGALSIGRKFLNLRFALVGFSRIRSNLVEEGEKVQRPRSKDRLKLLRFRVHFPSLPPFVGSVIARVSTAVQLTRTGDEMGRKLALYFEAIHSPFAAGIMTV